MSLDYDLIKDVAEQGEKQGVDGIAIYQEEYFKEPSYINVTKNYHSLMEAKRLRVYDGALIRIHFGIVNPSSIYTKEQ